MFSIPYQSQEKPKKNPIPGTKRKIWQPECFSFLGSTGNVPEHKYFLCNTQTKLFLPSFGNTIASVPNMK
jgi:hypothetical protein